MMVPRAYSAAPFGSSPPPDFDEKENFSKHTRPKEIPRRKKSSVLSASPPRSRLAISFDSKSSSPPASSSSYRHRLQPSRPTTTTETQNDISRPAPTPQQPLRRRESAQSILASTAIPIRRKPRQHPKQRLPNCDHVSDFSRLLQEDIRPGNGGSLSSSVGNPQFEGLFGHIDELVEGGMIVGSGGLDSGILTTRSISTESIASLASPDDFSSADNLTPSPSMSRLNFDRKVRQLPRAESCEAEHPLMHFEKEDTSSLELSISPPSRKSTPRAPKQTSFKSSLTASLRAIKSAAQSMSNYATTPTLQPDEFLSHSVFDFQPSMTDDRRPPPSSGPPSPALRRYLNPDYSTHTDSPAQLHFWLDHRSSPPSPSSKFIADPTSLKPKIKKKYLKDKSKGDSKLPPIVPLATCIPSAVRTAHASSPPIWLAPDGTPSNKRTGPQVHAAGAVSNSLAADGEVAAAFTGLKQREPRENRDFLRVFVAEMEMRRRGKLDERAEGRARLWLPPVEEKEGGSGGKGTGSQRTEGGDNLKGSSRMERWRSWSADEV